jgi:hypothetical protein
MRVGTPSIISIVIVLALPACAQSFLAPNPSIVASRPAPELSLSAEPPRMSAALALETYEQRSARQGEMLAAYTASTTVAAELPDTAQRGEFELTREYVAPRTLKFKAIRFEGDKFVKSNVILRMLQSEVTHVEKQEGPQTAINSANYKFSYKGVQEIDGRPVHVYAVKPRQKRSGLFKGKIYLDVATGSLRRAEGTIVKNPSFFIKSIEFVQDYADFDHFTFPVHIHSVAKTRLVGRAIVDVFTRGYAPSVQSALLASGSAGGN